MLRSVAGAVDEWNVPAAGADSVVVSGYADIEPLTLIEVAALSDAGAQVGDFRALTHIDGILSSDRVRDAAGRVYEVRSILPFRTHTQLLLRRVTP